MPFVDRAAVWRDGWAGKSRRIAGLPYLPVVAAAVLGLLAVAELVVGLVLERGPIAGLAVTTSFGRTGSGSVSVQFVLVLGLLCLSTTLPVALLRPVAGGIAVSAASVLSLAMFQTLTAAGVAAQLIAGYRLGRSGAQLLAVIAGVPFLVLALVGPASLEVRSRTVLLASLVPVAALAGIAQRVRSVAIENTATQQVIAGTLMAHTARGERARIARELHDVVAHHISMIAVQAETARLATPGMPAEGAKRLLGIGDTARAALKEMRRLLGVLREDTQASGDRHPQPGLRQLNELLDEARGAAGTATRLIVRGSPDTLDPGVELTAYRIVQESLTNARRHAPGAAIDVELHYTDDALRLRIRDNGPGPSPGAAAGGHGLMGMRERAAAVGGEVRTGPAVGGGFLVEASLPAKTEGPR
jgi:signal transduction histidine kinase